MPRQINSFTGYKNFNELQRRSAEKAHYNFEKHIKRWQKNVRHATQLRTSQCNSKIIGEPILVLASNKNIPQLNHNPSFVDSQHMLACHLSGTQEQRRFAFSASMLHAETESQTNAGRLEANISPQYLQDSLIKDHKHEAVQNQNSIFTQSQMSPRSLVYNSMEGSRFKAS